MLRDRQVSHCVGHRELVANLRRELAGAFKARNSGVVAPRYLMEAADPEQRLGLAVRIAELLIELHRALEQRQFRRILGPLVEEAGVQNAAAGQSEVGLDRVQLSLSGCQSSAVATEDGPFVQLPGPLDP